MTEYPWHTVIDSITMSWASQGDEWLHRFTRALAKKSVSLGEQRYDETTAPYIRISLQSGADAGTVVLLAVTAETVFVLLAGASSVGETLTGAVTSAAEHATAELGAEGEDIPWTAIIGQGPEQSDAGVNRLSAEVLVGPMRLKSTEQVFIEPETTQQRSLTSWGIQRSVPILVNGSSRGYSWDAAKVHAVRKLHTLCGLLSVMADETIIIREAPAPAEWGDRVAPTSPPWYQHPPSDLDSFDISTATAFALPEDLDSAWIRLQKEPVLTAAVDMYLEASQATPRHPSLAAVSFVASIETITAKLFKFKRCEVCANKLGLGMAFKSALRKVLSEEEAEVLDSVYSARSKTVHAGILHGGETTPGIMFRGPWSEDTASDFRWQTLRRLQHAARALLVWSIVQPWPARTTITPTAAEGAHSCQPPPENS